MERVVALTAHYFEHRVRGRITGLRFVGDDDLIVSVEDVRDGRTHLFTPSTISIADSCSLNTGSASVPPPPCAKCATDCTTTAPRRRAPGALQSVHHPRRDGELTF